MTRRERQAAGFVIWGLLLTAWAAGAGCSCHLYSVCPLPEEAVQECTCVPAACRGHVHVFFVTGADPLDCANLEGVKDYFQSLGFHNTWFGHWYHVKHFQKEILRVHRCDPDARFVVVGLVNGTNPARKLAEAVGTRGVCIDLLIYLDTNLLSTGSPGRPDTVRKVVTVLAGDPDDRRVAASDDDEDLYVAGVGPFAAPTHSGTLRILTRELSELACSVPVVRPPAPRPFPETGPTPHPVVPAADEGQRDAWDFLRPASTQDRSEAPPASPGS